MRANDSKTFSAAHPEPDVEEQRYRWTPARLLIGGVLVLGTAALLGYIAVHEFELTASRFTPAASAQSGANDRGHVSAPLEQFDTGDLRVDRSRILSGGPPKDGIPALTDPNFIDAADADFLGDESRVVSVSIEGETRAYPLNILNWHEVINDEIADVPIAVVYCPLCDSVSVVDRRLGEKTFEFGVSGLLMNSNVLLYDRTDEALWSQAGLSAISGPHAGQSLQHLDGWAIVSYEQWKREHPDGKVVSADTGHHRNYRRNPYGRYFANDDTMFPVSPKDDRYPKKMRVVGVRHGDTTRAYPLKAVREAPEGRLSDVIEGDKLVLEVEPGSGNVRISQTPPDAEVLHTFWFAWYAFHPDTQLYTADGKTHP